MSEEVTIIEENVKEQTMNMDDTITTSTQTTTTTTISNTTKDPQPLLIVEEEKNVERETTQEMVTVEDNNNQKQSSQTKESTTSNKKKKKTELIEEIAISPEMEAELGLRRKSNRTSKPVNKFAIVQIQEMMLNSAKRQKRSGIQYDAIGYMDDDELEQFLDEDFFATESDNKRGKSRSRKPAPKKEKPIENQSSTITTSTSDSNTTENGNNNNNNHNDNHTHNNNNDDHKNGIVNVENNFDEKKESGGDIEMSESNSMGKNEIQNKKETDGNENDAIDLVQNNSVDDSHNETKSNQQQSEDHQSDMEIETTNSNTISTKQSTAPATKPQQQQSIVIDLENDGEQLTNSKPQQTESKPKPKESKPKETKSKETKPKEKKETKKETTPKRSAAKKREDEMTELFEEEKPRKKSSTSKPSNKTQSTLSSFFTSPNTSTTIPITSTTTTTTNNSTSDKNETMTTNNSTNDKNETIVASNELENNLATTSTTTTTTVPITPTTTTVPVAPKPAPAPRTIVDKRRKAKREVTNEFDAEYVAELASKYPDKVEDWSRSISKIDSQHKLNLERSLPHSGCIYRASISFDGTMMATVSSSGTLKIWDLRTLSEIAELVDRSEEEIDEYYCVCWVDNVHVAVSGKRKDRKRWSEEDDDNHYLPPYLKLFDLRKGEVVSKGQRHTEEIYYLRYVEFKGAKYIVSASEDGSIIKWRINETCSEIKWAGNFDDNDSTNVALYVDFVPNCGNKFMMACCDAGLKLYDFESEDMINSWPNLYSSHCDCIRFISSPVDLDIPDSQDFWLISKGVEEMNSDNEVLKPNKLQLHKLSMPNEESEITTWELNQEITFGHEQYHANFWLTEFGLNGRYIAAPTAEGKVFVWNIKTAKLVAIIPTGQETGLRAVLFQPNQKRLFCAAEDGKISVFTQ